tara:strand:- start:188 stop:1105 length:918 start_codon:yes stop_codon:yes gene_type:complete
MNNKLYEEDEINITEILRNIHTHKYLILATTLSFVIASLIYSMLIENIYTSKTILASTSNDQGLSSKISGYSALAGIAGINMPAESASKTEEAIERIKSFKFFSNYFLPNVKLENIMAVKKWDIKNNILIYDDKIYESNTDKWVRKVSPPKKNVPSEQEAYALFMQALSIIQNKENSFVTISISHKSPHIAKSWLELIVYNINESMRQEDIEFSKTSIAFLNEAQKSENIQSVRDVVSNLLEAQMQTLMLASSNSAYVFKTLDAPLVPEEKSSPNRFFIIIFGLFIGLFSSLLAVIIKNFRVSDN